jgi:hypothetical protein
MSLRAGRVRPVLSTEIRDGLVGIVRDHWRR